VEISPLEVLANVTEKQLKDKFGEDGPKVKGMGCSRIRVVGKEKGKKTEYVLDLMCLPTEERSDPAGYATGVPSAIVAEMIAKGMIKKPGVIGPEEVVDPDYFFAECDKREIPISITKKEYIKQ
jgi:saccharopine dehydrogenase-like NADP-dependent oxidoreductase